MPSNHLNPCYPYLLLLSIFPNIRVIFSESALHIRWPKYWSFSFSISSSSEYSGLISFRMDWLDLLTVQGTLKSLLQHHSSKASILQQSAFFIVQLSYSYMTPGKTIALNILVGKVMSLLQITADSDCSHEIKRRLLLGRKSMTNLDIILPTRICIASLLRKQLLILWLQPLSSVILKPKKIIPTTVSTFSPSINHKVMEPDAMILGF